jgi:hypothetical protein
LRKTSQAAEKSDGFNRVKEEMRLLKRKRELEKQIALKVKKRKQLSNEELIRLRLPSNVLLKIV